MPLQPIQPIQPVKPRTVQPIRPVTPAVNTYRPPNGTVMSTAGGGPTLRDWIKKISDWAKAARAQMKAYNPNTWGTSGPGYFQGIQTPRNAPNAVQSYKLNVPDWLKPWDTKK